MLAPKAGGRKKRSVTEFGGGKIMLMFIEMCKFSGVYFTTLKLRNITFSTKK